MNRLVNRISVWLYRRTNGRLVGRGRGQLPVLLLTVPGRKTGLPHTVPVVYFANDGEFVLVGTGFNGTNVSPQWFLNLATVRAGRIQIGERDYHVNARLASGAERERLWAQIAGRAPHFAKWQTRVQRTLPIIVLTPDQG